MNERLTVYQQVVVESDDEEPVAKDGAWQRKVVLLGQRRVVLEPGVPSPVLDHRYGYWLQVVSGALLSPVLLAEGMSVVLPPGSRPWEPLAGDGPTVVQLLEMVWP